MVYENVKNQVLHRYMPPVMRVYVYTLRFADKNRELTKDEVYNELIGCGADKDLYTYILARRDTEWNLRPGSIVSFDPGDGVITQGKVTFAPPGGLGIRVRPDGASWEQKITSPGELTVFSAAVPGALGLSQPSSPTPVPTSSPGNAQSPTCKRWAPAEERQLKTLVQMHQGSIKRMEWELIANKLGTGRTCSALKQHWSLMQQHIGEPSASASQQLSEPLQPDGLDRSNRSQSGATEEGVERPQMAAPADVPSRIRPRTYASAEAARAQNEALNATQPPAIVLQRSAESGQKQQQSEQHLVERLRLYEVLAQHGVPQNVISKFKQEEVHVVDLENLSPEEFEELGVEGEWQQKRVQCAAAAWRVQTCNGTKPPQPAAPVNSRAPQENVVHKHHSSAHDAGMRNFRSKVKEFISESNFFDSQSDAATQLAITKTALNEWLNGVNTHRLKDKDITEVMVSKLLPLANSTLKQAAEAAGLGAHSAAAVGERYEPAAAAYAAPNLDHQRAGRAQQKPDNPDVYPLSDDEPLELQASRSDDEAPVGSPLEHHTSGKAASASLLTAAQQHATCPPSANDVEGSLKLLCVLCKLKKPTANFSKTQLRKGATVRRCMECTGPQCAAAQVTAVDHLSTAVTCDRHSSSHLHQQQQPERQQRSHWSSNADHHQPQHQHQQPEQQTECRRLFVGGLPSLPDSRGSVQEIQHLLKYELEQYFSKFGPVQEILIITDRNTGRPRGFGFVKFEDSRSRSAALQQGRFQTINRQQVEVKPAHSRGTQAAMNECAAAGAGRNRMDPRAAQYWDHNQELPRPPPPPPPSDSVQQHPPPPPPPPPMTNEELGAAAKVNMMEKDELKKLVKDAVGKIVATFVCHEAAFVNLHQTDAEAHHLFCSKLNKILRIKFTNGKRNLQHDISCVMCLPISSKEKIRRLQDLITQEWRDEIAKAIADHPLQIVHTSNQKREEEELLAKQSQERELQHDEEQRQKSHQERERQELKRQRQEQLEKERQEKEEKVKQEQEEKERQEKEEKERQEQLEKERQEQEEEVKREQLEKERQEKEEKERQVKEKEKQQFQQPKKVQQQLDNSKDELEQIKMRIQEVTEELEENVLMECSICQEVLDQRPHTTNCQHHFHQTCIKKWFDKGRRDCPMCKHPIPNTRSNAAQKQDTGMASSQAAAVKVIEELKAIDSILAQQARSNPSQPDEARVGVQGNSHPNNSNGQSLCGKSVLLEPETASVLNSPAPNQWRVDADSAPQTPAGARPANTMQTSLARESGSQSRHVGEKQTHGQQQRETIEQQQQQQVNTFIGIQRRRFNRPQFDAFLEQFETIVLSAQVNVILTFERSNPNMTQGVPLLLHQLIRRHQRSAQDGGTEVDLQDRHVQATGFAYAVNEATNTSQPEHTQPLRNSGGQVNKGGKRSRDIGLPHTERAHNARSDGQPEKRPKISRENRRCATAGAAIKERSKEMSREDTIRESVRGILKRHGGRCNGSKFMAALYQEVSREFLQPLATKGNGQIGIAGLIGQLWPNGDGVAWERPVQGNPIVEVYLKSERPIHKERKANHMAHVVVTNTAAGLKRAFATEPAGGVMSRLGTANEHRHGSAEWQPEEGTSSEHRAELNGTLRALKVNYSQSWGKGKGKCTGKGKSKGKGTGKGKGKGNGKNWSNDVVRVVRINQR